MEKNVTFFPFFILHIFYACKYENASRNKFYCTYVHMATETTNMFDVCARDRVRGVALKERKKKIHHISLFYDIFYLSCIHYIRGYDMMKRRKNNGKIYRKKRRIAAT